ncbi:hypothetical protein ACIBCM_17935 [Streptomyces sp. NPDC051018]|uniref:hypothetical protein n=1 Tax=Streptomyces sp. NPDC051018 TaxID=3365639 RepID=UPI0037A71AE6
MPRPTAAQLASGSATVVFSALALLLFTGTTHALGVAAIGVASMALGLLVATVLPMSRAVRASRPLPPNRVPAPPAASADGLATRVPAPPAASADGLATRVPGPRAHAAAGAEARFGEHSLGR